MTIRSMTGFARVRRQTEQGEILLSMKSVNHRGLDLHFHMSPSLDCFENTMRSAIKRKVGRGHVDVRVTLNRAGSAPAFALNQALLEGYLAAFEGAAREHGLDTKPDLNAAFRVPGMLEEVADPELPTELESHLLQVLDEALSALNAFREREGMELAGQMRHRNEAIREATRRMLAIRSRATQVFQQRLSERLGELLRNANLDPQRLAQEAAVLADRSDIGEELARLEIHALQLDQLLGTGSEVGKKLDFLLQEMNRETNTVLSKTSGIGEIGLSITELALGVKSDIEKIREQGLNLE